MKLAQALLLRKQLQEKVDQLRPVKLQGANGVFELQTKRVNVNDNTDEIQFQIPKVTLADVTATFDHYATELRKIDAAIQQANWACDCDYSEKKVPTAKPSEKSTVIPTDDKAEPAAS